jgi:hypothetical protein
MGRRFHVIAIFCLIKRWHRLPPIFWSDEPGTEFPRFSSFSQPNEKASARVLVLVLTGTGTDIARVADPLLSYGICSLQSEFKLSPPPPKKKNRHRRGKAGLNADTFTMLNFTIQMSYSCTFM